MPDKFDLKSSPIQKYINVTLFSKKRGYHEVTVACTVCPECDELFTIDAQYLKDREHVTCKMCRETFAI